MKSERSWFGSPRRRAGSKAHGARSKGSRELAKSEEGRPDVVGWLREQERILKSSLQFAQFDIRFLWEELSLPYQGLETDPPGLL
ncbi:MAG: hypothetical protein DIU78_021060 [Pseudomonadota bacterium]|nr:MAG: hypothetical protein DIU78_09540 [Pseudomonadota bacterium]